MGKPLVPKCPAAIAEYTYDGNDRLAIALDPAPRNDGAERWRFARLELLEFHLAEFHDALAVLQRDVPAREPVIGSTIDGFGAVERHGEFRTRGFDVEGVPLVGGFQ